MSIFLDSPIIGMNSRFVTLTSALLIVATATGTFMTLILAFSRRGETRTLGLFTLLMTAVSLLQLLVSLKSVLMLYLPFVIFPATFLQGVIIDLYIRKMLGFPGYRREKLAILCIPAVLAAAAQITMFVLFPEFRDLEAVYQQRGIINSYTAVLFIVTLCYGLFFLLPATQRVYSTTRTNTTEKNRTTNSSHAWLLVFLVFNVLLNLAGLSNTLYNIFAHMPAPASPVMAVLLSGGNFLILTFLIRQPAIFAVSQAGDPRGSDTKYAKIQSLDESTRKEYIKRIQHHLMHEEPYLDDTFNLNQLSEQVGIPTHLVSMVINTELRQNFYSLINSYRVNRAKELLLSETESNILRVAYASGFQSKSAFNKVFKQFTGQTPSAYKKS